MDLIVDGVNCLDSFKVTLCRLENSNGDLDQDNEGQLEKIQAAAAIARRLSLLAESMEQLETDYVHVIFNSDRPISSHCESLIDIILHAIKTCLLLQREYNIRYNVISVIMILMLLSCSHGFANDMMHIMMFITVIHLISGDIEINPGPQFNAQDLKKKPEISDLHRIFIKFRAAHRFVTIGVALKVEVNDLIYSPLDIETKLYLVFDRWIEKNENVTWGKIVEVCDDFELGLVCEAISDFLSRQSKYKREADFDSTGTERTNKNGYFTKTDVLLLIFIVLVCYFICLSWTDCKC
ncbi:PREDICTED: uncharacterized protein LOC109590695 [Amphimedon queenslandica]|uniref:Death domain-containing protein n=1 Tax=Amphimedon queenslandica TaxID=400682 RepID=A0A1X7SZN3_AMPQE|nr:PREDICTED: uncharacterized protein LOC109590695 [Amphimedon queenslandica]|eukprot:XP_019862138.1 PREDICTED: uncharacterized protein LOC109590695 [Amphimedon queenslandica]